MWQQPGRSKLQTLGSRPANMQNLQDGDGTGVTSLLEGSRGRLGDG